MGAPNVVEHKEAFHHPNNLDAFAAKATARPRGYVTCRPLPLAG